MVPPVLIDLLLTALFNPYMCVSVAIGLFELSSIAVIRISKSS
jgi:hypothetical protein